MKVLILSTDDPLVPEDILLRSIWPADQRPGFWQGKRLSSAAFKDPKGLSVSRVYTRPISEAVEWMSNHFHGPVYSVTMFTCSKIGADVKNKPSEYVPYHYEIHGGESDVELSDEQALILSRSAKEEKTE